MMSEGFNIMDLSKAKLNAALVMLSALGAPLIAHAQGYPTKPIRLIVPFAPGGNTDVSGRLIAKGLSDALGQQVVVENKPGASGSLGADVVAKSPADGYTLLLGSSALTINPAVYEKIPYDVTKDLEPVGVSMVTSLVLVAAPNKGIRTVAELIANAKTKPEGLVFGSAGTGSGSHLAGELFNQTAHIKTMHVPYKGSGPATVAVVSGEVNYTFTSQAGALPLYKTGKLVALAITGKTPSPLFPGIPTIEAAGVKDYEAGDWIGILAPAGTPKPIINKLNNEMTKWVTRPETVARLAELGFEPHPGTAEQFRNLIRSELVKWNRIAKAANVKAE